MTSFFQLFLPSMSDILMICSLIKKNNKIQYFQYNISLLNYTYNKETKIDQYYSNKMKKNKSGEKMDYLQKSLKNNEIDSQIQELQKKQKQTSQQILIKKNELLLKQIQLLKQGRKTLQKQLSAYRNVVLKNGDIHNILQLQHQKIFDLQTNFQVLQNKYDRLLASNGSKNQTEYAIKCKQLQTILKNKEIQHQKQISTLKAKVMRMNASQMLDKSRGGSQATYQIYGRTNSMNIPITPIKNSKKFV